MAIEHNDWSLINLGKIIDVSDFVESPPWERGTFGYYRPGNVRYTPHEQIDPEIKEGSSVGDSKALARWGHPKFKRTFIKIKKIVEEVLGEKIYPTYYYDRFYFKGCQLEKHVDRGACEISISMHISTNATYDWPLYFQVNDKVIPVSPKAGEAVLYKGIEFEHWRDPLEGDRNTYFHQIFFHYVRANGNYVEQAYDRCIPI